MRFLKIADTGIHEIKCESEEFNSDKHLSEFPHDLRERITDDLNLKKAQQLLLLISQRNS